MYGVLFNGDKVKANFPDHDSAYKWALKHCKGGKFEVVGFTECALPKASRLHYNEDFENYGSYKYNPMSYAYN